MIDNYNKNVFINCPFDEDFKPIFNAILYTVLRCRFTLRCSKEFPESSTVRIQNIIRLIRESKYSIHDLSRVTKTGRLPRFNMPLELGIAMGAIEFGSRLQRTKKYLILESKRFRFQKFISDISGQDIQNHNDKPNDAIKVVRNWLSSISQTAIPSPSIIIVEYENFLLNLPDLCAAYSWIQTELTYDEYYSLVSNWITIDQI